MDRHYVEQDMVEKSFVGIEAMPAVIDADERVGAHADLVVVGEAAIVSRILALSCNIASLDSGGYFV